MKKFLSVLKNFIHGFLVGSAMLVPGVSGGTTAIILGIYDRLVSAVSSFFKDISKNLLFLGTVALGGAAGVLLVAKPLGALVDRFEAPMLCLFMGAAAGSLPLLLRKSKGAKKPSNLIFAALGLGLVLAISFIPEGLFEFNTGSVSGFFLLLALGVPLAVGLVLPGISITYLMLVVGIYKPLLAAIDKLDIGFLAPLAIGIGLGVILTTRTLEKAMERRPGPTYFVIIGFVLGSIYEIIRELPALQSPWLVPLCVILFAGGFAGIWYYAKKTEG